MFGFLNIYKPKGKTSHDVVAVLRRITKIKQIGHTGTLDPFAEGVLPVCIGKATRLIEYLDDDKAYVGTVKLGSSTTTYDIDGDIVAKSDKKVLKEDIENVLKNFYGEIEQIPPIYSAIKVGGRKLYEYARNGENVEIKPRKVCIKKLEILNYNFDQGELVLYISCSKGTYIRSIANDLGNMLGTYGHLIKLVRVKAGKFLIENSVPLENIQSVEDVNKYIISPLDFMGISHYELNENELEKVSHGMDIKANLINVENNNIALINGSKLAAIGLYKDGIIKCVKVFI